MYDVVIIGAGPAGVSAALYVKRANLNPIILFHGESQLEKAHKIDNFYGFPDGISGKDLYADGIKQAKNLGIEVFDEEVTGIEFASEKSYNVSTANNVYEATSVIIATGNKKLKPLVKRIEELEGKGVSYCATCDGFFYRKKKVCVIGSALYAFTEASHLAHIAESVSILTNGDDAQAINELIKANPDVANKISVDTRKVVEIVGAEKVEGVAFSEGENLEVQGVFVALGNAGGADFAKKLGIELEKDSIKVNDKMETNAKGIFAAGNVSGGLLQVCKAVYEGGVAGLSAINYVRSVK